MWTKTENTLAEILNGTQLLKLASQDVRMSELEVLPDGDRNWFRMGGCYHFTQFRIRRNEIDGRERKESNLRENHSNRAENKRD